MKRDMDLIRSILLVMENSEDGWAPDPLEIGGYSQEQIGYHLALMIEGGLLIGQIDPELDMGPPVGVPERLTWEGHDFIDAAREQSRWNQAKKSLEKVGGAAFQVWISVLTELTKGSLGLV